MKKVSGYLTEQGAFFTDENKAIIAEFITFLEEKSSIDPEHLLSLFKDHDVEVEKALNAIRRLYPKDLGETNDEDSRQDHVEEEDQKRTHWKRQ